MKTLSLLLFSLISISSFSADKDWKCIREDGSVAFSLKAKFTSKFSEGLADVKISRVENNAWVSEYGFVNTKGELVIPCQFDKIKGRGFVLGRAWVRKTGSKYWTLIDKNGTEIPTKDYKKVGYIFEQNEGVMAVYVDGKMGFINEDGKEIIPCKYTGSSSFDEGLACVALYNTDKYGFMNNKGEMEIPMKFSQSGTTSFGPDKVSRANVAGRTVLIDRKGNVVFKTSKGNVQRTTLNKVRVFTNGTNRTGWGLLGYDDKWAIQPIYDKLSVFNEKGIAEAVKEGFAGLIDSTGAMILDFKYEHIYHEAEERGFYLALYKTKEAQSMNNTPKDFFTPDLKPLILDDVSYIYSANGGKLMRYTNDSKKSGYLNRNFEKVIPAKYSKSNDFTEGLAWVVE